MDTTDFTANRSSAASAPASAAAPAARPRHRLVLALAGCGLLALCVLGVCSVNAVYWTLRIRTAGLAEESSPEEIREALARLPAGDPEAGEQVFRREAGCSACHSLEAGERVVGPSLAGLAARAGSARPGYSAEMYVYESIVAPDAYLAAGFQGGIMPGGFAQRLDERQLADLVAFLLSR
jgi:mono/diheme cytochrome c family protein